MASWWRVGGGGREREKEETFSSSVFYFHPANFFPAVSFDFDRSGSRRFSVPPMENAFSADPDPARRGGTKRDNAGKMGKRYTHPLMERPTNNYYHRKIHALYNTALLAKFSNP